MSINRSSRVAERLPEFYRAWDPDSVIYKLIGSFAWTLDEQQREMFRISRTHWVETAHLSDLDAVGALFDLQRTPGESDESYRPRVKNGVLRFRGGGTKESIIAGVASLLKCRMSDLTMIENPPTPLLMTRSVTSGGEMAMGSMGVEDVEPGVEISVETEGGKIVDPALTVKETDAQLLFTGTLRHGSRLVIEGTRATLDGEDVSAQLQKRGSPLLLRSGSTWVFREELSARVEGFDRASFDHSVFERPVPTVRVTFSWMSRLPSSFELTVPRAALERRGFSGEDVEGLLNVIKAQGVNAILRIAE